MIAIKLKKAFLIMGMGIGLGAAAFSASAFPSYNDCKDMAAECAATGNAIACDTVQGLCWKYGF